MPNFVPRLASPAQPPANPWLSWSSYLQNPFTAWQTGRLPLSGDVTQAINPWSWTFGSASSQVGLVNINLGRSSDPERTRAREHLIGLFAAVGNDDPRVLAGRRNLASALF